MGSVLFGFRDSDRENKINPNDPQNVLVPPNLSGFKRVVISLPESLTINEVLTDLVEEGYLNGIEEHALREDNHYIISRENELETKELINYLNNKFGFIAHKGYVKPTHNIVVDNTYGLTTDNTKSTHVALVQSPDGTNPNDQFNAYRREYDPETEFPKFERVDIEQIIHYTRNEDNIIKNNNRNAANNALSAMVKGEEIDITETERVKDYDAVKIDYIEKVRKLRLQLNNIKYKRKLNKYNMKYKIQQQFKYDHMLNLIDLKTKKYAINRAKRIYELQREQRLDCARLKQNIDPNLKETKYNKHQNEFWEEFDHSTKRK